MKKYLIAMTCVGVVLPVVSGRPLHGQTTRYFCATNSNSWSDGYSWWTNSNCTGSNGVPTEADKAVVNSGVTCNVDISNAVADYLEVQSTATLTIQAGSAGNIRKLTLDGEDQGATSTIAGTLNLDGQYSQFIFTTTSPTLSGSGKIVGKHNNATLDFAGLDLISNITVEGNLTIQATDDDDVFKNQGTVNANRNGRILFQNCAIDDVAAALWKVSADTTAQGTAKLQFNHQYPSNQAGALLDGEFSITSGILRVNANIISSGKLYHYSGNAESAAGVYIRCSNL